MKGKGATWIAVLDSKTALFFERKAHQGITMLPDNLTAVPIRTNKPAGRSDLGRVHDRMGNARHTLEPHTSERTQERTAFMCKVAEYLQLAYSKGKFDHLILVAPPKLLGLLRKVLASAVSESVSLEITKDLHYLHTNELRDHLEKLINMQEPAFY